ncbi:MAG: glycosyltransferase family 4 protein [Candidatus Krumholzibacteriota bacterium]|nr:glycosyltransferase family 4 protein [Candidatus Krumholzibacteriota bacterium]
MRILAINWRDIRNPEAGGAELHLHEILSRLVHGGHEATLIAAAWPGCEAEASIDGVRVLRRGHWYDANLVLPVFARRHMRHNEYDVVVEDINKLPFFMPLFTKTPVVATIPHLFGTTVFREAGVPIGLYVLFLEKFIPRVYRASRFMVISPSTRDDLVARGVPADRIDVILCGLDHDTWRHLDIERHDRPTIVHLGRLRRYKSVEVALRATKIVRCSRPDARLVIVGDGPWRPALEKEAASLGLGDGVEFRGFMEHEELVRLLNRSHLLFNPSPKEGWGLTVVEANACGLPVVASDRPGLRDSVIDGETGFLVPYGDETAFAEKALELIENDPLWRRMSAAALARVKELTWERCALESEALFRRVAGGGKEAR